MEGWAQWLQSTVGGAAQMYSQYKWSGNAVAQPVTAQPASTPASAAQPIQYVEGRTGAASGVVISSTVLLVAGAAVVAYLLAKN
jgi:hypothetical protein